MKLVKVTPEDWKYVYDLRNSKNVRKSCYDTKPISFKRHTDYMKNFKGFQWIVFVKNKKIGHCKIVNNEIGVMVDGKFRGNEYGIKIIKFIFNKAQKLGIKKLESNVRCDNYFSVLMSIKSGLELEKINIIKNEKYYHFRKVFG